LGEFDTLQLFEDGIPNARVPYWKGDDPTTGKLEPIAKAYTDYGKGGAVQLHANRQVITFKRVKALPEE